MLLDLVCLFLLAQTLAISDAAGHCKPFTIIMTRAVGAPAEVRDGKLVEKYPLSSVNLANIHGALKYVMSETIDYESGYTKGGSSKCRRKNEVSYIQFFKVVICNTDATLWWFNPSRPHGYGSDSNVYSLSEFGVFMTMDNGACHTESYCGSLTETGKYPYLGPFIGYKEDQHDPRVPTANSYWFSIPGSCPLVKWKEKTDECKNEYPSGKCTSGKPNGENCTWNYDFLGQVDIDDLNGIRSIINPNTGKTYVDHLEYCLAGNVEFERSKEFDFVKGLDFWKDPKSESANAQRVEKLLEIYHNKTLYPFNIPIPKEEELKRSNPPCYQTVRACGDGKVEGTKLCTRDSSMLCHPCKDEDEKCPVPPPDWEKDRLPELPFVSLPTKKIDSTPPPTGDASKYYSTFWTAIITILVVILS